MDYDTVRIKFQYGEMDWMVQLWKGNYAITNGGEIGIYHKPTDRLIEFYDCAENSELPQMAMTLRRGDQILFTRGLQPHWWMTGFQLGTLYKPAQLTLDGQLIFEDSRHAGCICKSLPPAGLPAHLFHPSGRESHLFLLEIKASA